MINGIMQKIQFSEQIGNGDYDTNFVLQSNQDKLGIALLTMRNNLKKSNEILVEQDKRLIDAQKLAKVGNYLLDTKTWIFQSSATFDEIMGIDETFEKTIHNWVSLIAPDVREYMLAKGIESQKERTKFSETYLINKYNTGQEVWVSVIGENSYDEHGNTVSMFGTMQDITASKTLELELNNSYKIATEQNRRLLNFSYIVSHNLRMHAVNINGLIKWYQECESDAERKETITMMEKASTKKIYVLLPPLELNVASKYYYVRSNEP
jgi:PAS domain S-box-containing protein